MSVWQLLALSRHPEGRLSGRSQCRLTTEADIPAADQSPRETSSAAVERAWEVNASDICRDPEAGLVAGGLAEVHQHEARPGEYVAQRARHQDLARRGQRGDLRRLRRRGPATRPALSATMPSVSPWAASGAAARLAAAHSTARVGPSKT